MAKFAYNNSVHSSTKKTPFSIVLGKYPRWPFIPNVTTSINPHVEHHLQQLQQVHIQVMVQLQQAQNNFQCFLNDIDILHPISSWRSSVASMKRYSN
jgi:hypothetical protein